VQAKKFSHYKEIFERVKATVAFLGFISLTVLEDYNHHHALLSVKLLIFEHLLVVECIVHNYWW